MKLPKALLPPRQRLVTKSPPVRAEAKLSDLLEELMDCDWPGNVRQLENIVLRVIALPEITQLGLSGTADVAAPAPATADSPAANSYPADAEFIEQKDREIILWALEKTRFNASSAARILEIPRSTFRSKMEKYDIDQGEPAN